MFSSLCCGISGLPSLQVVCPVDPLFSIFNHSTFFFRSFYFLILTALIHRVFHLYFWSTLLPVTALPLMWAVWDMWQLRPYFASSCAIPLWSHPSCSCRFTCLILPHCLTWRISVHTSVENRTKLDPQKMHRVLGYGHNIKKWHLLDKHFKISLLQKHWALFLLCVYTSLMHSQIRNLLQESRRFQLCSVSLQPLLALHGHSLQQNVAHLSSKLLQKKKKHTQQRGEPIWSATHHF